MLKKYLNKFPKQRPMIGMGKAARQYGNLFKQVDPHDPDADLHTGRGIENEPDTVHR